MPTIGEIRKAKEIEYRGSNKYIWSACLDCNKQSWKRFEKGIIFHPRCGSCASKIRMATNRLYAHKHPLWKGGRLKTASGYIEIKVHPSDFFFAMAGSDHRIKEHRLVMAKHLKRCLLSWEIVHHKNHIRDDNRIENLRLVATDDRHKQITILEKRVKVLEKRVTLFEAENICLKTGVCL